MWLGSVRLWYYCSRTIIKKATTPHLQVTNTCDAEEILDSYGK